MPDETLPTSPNDPGDGDRHPRHPDGREQPPESIGKYKVLKLLGEGGMGVVYLAWHPDLATEVALKVIKRPPATPEFLQRLSREVRAMSDVRHPNVVSVMDAGIWESPHGPHAFYVMESLKPPFRLDDPALIGRLDLRAKVKLLADAARGLAAAHNRGIIHADIKPLNILVEDRDGVLTPKIADFGLARVTSAWGERPDPSVGGTTAYLAPELLDRGGKDPDARSDVYAFGVTIHEVLVGRKPSISGASADPGDAKLRSILERALTEQLLDRFPSAVELAEALRSWCENPVARALASLRRSAGSHPFIAFLLCTLVTGVFGFGVGVPLSRSPWVNRAVLPLVRVESSLASAEAKFVIVDLADREKAAAAALARVGEAQLGAVDTSSGVSMRKVHGVLAERLARAEAAAVGWDMIYSLVAPKSDDNARLKQGLEALRKTTPFTLAAGRRVWSGGRDSGAIDPDVWDALHDSARLAMAAPTDIGPVVTLATRVPDADLVDSFPVSIAFRRSLSEELRLRFSPDRDQCLVYVGKRGRDDDAREGVGRLVKRLPISSFEYGVMNPDAARELAFPLGTEELSTPVRSVDRSTWDQRLVPAHRVLAMSDRELLDFAGAIVLVCDSERDVADFGTGPIPGGFLQAATIATLLESDDSLRAQTLRVPNASTAAMLTLLAAAWGGGVLMLWPARGPTQSRRGQTSIRFAGVCLVTFGVALLACRASASWWNMLIHPAPIVCAVVSSLLVLTFVFPAAVFGPKPKEVAR